MVSNSKIKLIGTQHLITKLVRYAIHFSEIEVSLEKYIKFIKFYKFKYYVLYGYCNNIPSIVRLVSNYVDKS